MIGQHTFYHWSFVLYDVIFMITILTDRENTSAVAKFIGVLVPLRILNLAVKGKLSAPKK